MAFQMLYIEWQATIEFFDWHYERESFAVQNTNTLTAVRSDLLTK